MNDMLRFAVRLGGNMDAEQYRDNVVGAWPSRWQRAIFAIRLALAVRFIPYELRKAIAKTEVVSGDRIRDLISYVLQPTIEAAIRSMRRDEINKGILTHRILVGPWR
jgi:hypothetical protein